MKITLLITLVLSLSIFGCGKDPRSTQIPRDKSEWKTDPALNEAITQLSQEEQDLLKGYMFNSIMAETFGANGMPDEQTIGGAIDAQRALVEKKDQEKKVEAVKKEQAQRAKEDAIANMNNAVEAVLLTLKFNPADAHAQRYSGSFDIAVGFKNKTDKEISGVKGVITFKDMFDEPIKMVRLSNDQPIPANGKALYRGSIDYNQFMDEDKKLRSLDAKKVKFEWAPEVYIFNDGSKLEVR